MRTALMTYFVTVILLAWWPWNGWLIVFGAAYCWRRRINGNSKRGRRVGTLTSPNTNAGAVGRSKGTHQPAIARDHLEAPVEYRWIA